MLPNWPANSPDLNTIENVWAYLSRKANKEGCINFEDFKDFVMNEFKNIPRSMLTNLYASMRDRVTKCIERAGDKTSF